MEPEGIVEIKYRQKDIIETMARLDGETGRLRARLAQTELSPEEKTKLEAELSARVKQLTPIYHQIAVHFADLHDTAERMNDKGVIQVNSVFFFYSNIFNKYSEPFLKISMSELWLYFVLVPFLFRVELQTSDFKLDKVNLQLILFITLMCVLS